MIAKLKRMMEVVKLNTIGTYDRAKMLSNIADNYIIPAYTNYELATSNLKDKVDAFNSTPSSTNITRS